MTKFAISIFNDKVCNFMISILFIGYYTVIFECKFLFHPAEYSWNSHSEALASALGVNDDLGLPLEEASGGDLVFIFGFAGLVRVTL